MKPTNEDLIDFILNLERSINSVKRLMVKDRSNQAYQQLDNITWNIDQYLKHWGQR